MADVKHFIESLQPHEKAILIVEDIRNGKVNILAQATDRPHNAHMLAECIKMLMVYAPQVEKKEEAASQLHIVAPTDALMKEIKQHAS